MSETNKVKVYKYKNIAAVMAVLLLILVAISTSIGKANKGKTTNNSSSSEAKAITEDDSSYDKSDGKSVYKAPKLTKNYEYQSVKNGEQLCNGLLVLVNSDHPFTGEVSNLDGIYSYLFDDNGNQIMYAVNTQISGNSTCLENFRKLVQDFHEETNLSTLMISQLQLNAENFNNDSNADSQENTLNSSNDESVTGFTIDLQLYDSVAGTYPEFDGEGKYAWIEENCSKYGFILRYQNGKSDVTGVSYQPNHFRYVGKCYSEIMNDQNLCLEEFIDFIKPFNFENPYSYKTDDGLEYAIYYVEADLNNTTTNIPLPLNDNDDRYSYEISGNNVDGYIVSINFNSDVNDLQQLDSNNSNF